MQQMTKEAIRKIQSDTGHELTVDDFDLVGDLDKICACVVGITSGAERSLVFPVEVGGATLYPLTIAKAELGEQMDLGMSDFIYLLSVPNDAPSLPTSQGFERGAKRFYRKLTCTEGELTEAFERVVSLSAGDSGDDKKSDWPLLVDLLCSEYGSTPEYWLYHESIELVKDLLDRLVARKHKQNQTAEKCKAPAPTMKIKYLHDFREKCKEIKSIWSKIDG